MKVFESGELEGFLLIDKPNGMTSSDCVQTIRSIVGRKIRVGHAGTLDAFATGLLVIGIGRPATRHLSSIMVLDKTYIAKAKLGQLTDTLDMTGIVMKQEIVEVTREQLEAAIAYFGSGYKQTPPVYSALKYQGRALSRIARAKSLDPAQLDSIAEEKSREIKIYSCKLIDFQPPFFTVQAHVSHGTYIRSFMNDIANQCGTNATTHDLRRLSIGPFNVTDALSLKTLKNSDQIRASLLSLSYMENCLNNYTCI